MGEVPEQYYTPTGTQITREKIVNDWIENYQNEYEGKLTDFSEGSEIRNILESFALSVYSLMYYDMLEYRQHWLIYSKGSYLDLKGTELRLPRKTGAYAQGTVTITLPSVQEEDISVDDLNFINPETGIIYSPYKNIIQINDDFEYVIPAGELQIEVPVICSINGSIGNTEIGTVTMFDDELSIDNVTVTNTIPITGGTDDETDDEYRSRLLARERNGSFGNSNWYENICTEIEGVHDAYVTYGGKFVKVYINGNVKPVSSYVLNLCLDQLNIKANHLLHHRFEVFEPNYIDLNLKIELNEKVIKNKTYGTTTKTFEVTENMILNRLQTLIDGGTDGDMDFIGYSLGETLKETDIISALTSIEGIASVTPYIANVYGQYVRFSEITCQKEEVVRLTNVIVEFRDKIEIYEGDD